MARKLTPQDVQVLVDDNDPHCPGCGNGIYGTDKSELCMACSLAADQPN